jgi:2-phosphosulfolactate phosphatase
MIIEALFLAQDAVQAGKQTIILIDVLRTSTTLVTMLGRGARNVIIAGRPEEARLHRERLGACLLCGETGGAKPSDFDYGNSPGDYADLLLEGKQAVFTSSNGVKAMLRLMGEGRRMFIGSYTNADAVVRAALADARQREADIVVVGSGRNHGTRYGIEDCHCAGFLIDRLASLVTGTSNWTGDQSPGACHRLDDQWSLEDSAIMALRLWRSFGLDFDLLLSCSGDAGILRSMGLGGDFPACLRVDASQVVPEVSRAPEGYLVVNPVVA